MTTTKPVRAETRWKCVCAFDGRPYKGWQSQVGGGTVQDEIEEALEKLFGRSIRIHGSSRTDAGVHARGMVFHFDGHWTAGPVRMEAALRTFLPSSIRVSPIRAVSPDFHARFSAVKKRYCYYIHQGWADPFSVNYCWSVPQKLDLEAMQAVAELLRGRHDFTSFSACAGRELETPVREIKRLSVKRNGRKLVIVAEADGFLYKMFRQQWRGGVPQDRDSKLQLPLPATGRRPFQGKGHAGEQS